MITFPRAHPKTTRRTATFALFAAALLSGCRSTAPAAGAGASGRLLEDRREIHWVRNSAEYRALLVQTYRLAGKRLEELAENREPGTWAVALDADETVVDNSPYQVGLARTGEAYTPETFDAWVGQRESPPLPGAVAFLAKVRELGGKIAIVTNRREHTCADTEADFEAFSIPFDVILCRGEERAKEPRWRRIADGSASSDLPPLEILMWIGDNVHDFPSQSQELRHAEESAFTAFGAEYFVVPNPMYGSWEQNPEK